MDWICLFCEVSGLVGLLFWFFFLIGVNLCGLFCVFLRDMLLQLEVQALEKQNIGNSYLR